MRAPKRLLTATLLAALAAPAAAAPPDARWRTIETPRFRLHYPIEAEAWAIAAAARLEAMRDRVQGEVGFELDRTVDIIVRDPYATSNGMALPFLKRPRMELWVSPPPADSVIGWNRRWDEGLIVHEDTHVVHMARPARGGTPALLDAFVGFGPIARNAPRWVTEGYATVVEGDLTGYGRPFSAQLAAELRKLAVEGALPRYDELDGSPRWAGGGYAYGIGSAFLRWLREREGPDSLRALWTRMAAVADRDFDEAFVGVFGDSPERLYGRFCAELTLAAMEHEQLLPPDRSTRFIDFEGSTGPPAVSPDGARVALVAGSPKRALQVWPTTFDAEKVAQDREKEVEDLLAADPLDIPDRVRPEPPLEQLHKRGRRDRAPAHPRWIDDETVLFTGFTPDRSGRLRADLYAWTPATGAERRITRHADVRDADPAPGGAWAVAVHQVWGASGLVRVDLATGETAELAPLSVEIVYDRPRVSPDGTRVAYLAMQDGPWELFVRPIDGPAARVALPEGANVTTPSWHPAGDRLLVSMGTDAWLDVVEVPLDGDAPRRLTRSHGGAFAPVASAEHLYFLGEDADGRDLHRIALPERGDPLPTALPPTLAQVPPPPVVPPLPTVQVASRPYGLGRTEGRGLVSGAFSRGDHRLELGARYGDIIGRHELLIVAAAAYTPSSAPKWADGARAALAIRSLPVEIHADAFAHRPIAGAGLVGASAALADSHRFPAGQLDASAGLGAGLGVDGPSRHLAFGAARLRLAERAHRVARLDAEIRAAGGAIGDGAGGWVRARTALDLFGDYVGLSAGFGASFGGASPLRLGGVRDATLPDAWQIDRVIRPAFLPLAGSRHLVTAARLGPGMGLMAERHVMGESLDLRRGTTVVGFEAATELERTPIGKLPAVVIESGFGCRLEDAVEGIRRRPCARIDDYTAWGAITWKL